MDDQVKGLAREGERGSCCGGIGRMVSEGEPFVYSHNQMFLFFVLFFAPSPGVRIYIAVPEP